MGCGKYTVEYWRSAIEAQGVDVPRHLAWMNEESGGCPAALGASYEVGIYQLDLEDGPAWGGSLETLHGDFSVSPTSQTLKRELSPDEEALQVSSGIAFITWAREHVQANLDHVGVTWGDDELWALTKLYHALPRLTDNYLFAAHNLGATSSWSDFASYLRGLSKEDAAGVNAKVAAKYWPFGKYVDNAEDVGFPGGGSFGSSFDLGSTLVVLLALAAAAYWLQHAHTV